MSGRVLIFALLVMGRVLGSEGAVMVKSGVELVDVWKEGQHVYVKGNVGVAATQLAGLEKWLDTEGKNWTVLIMQNAARESYVDARGLRYHGMDAVEHAMGKGLPAKTGFGDIVHPETGQGYGAFFILFLQERKFFFYGSEAYETRGLGARNWAGDLDGAAKRAMRNGGRIVEAAKGTVKLVEGRLASSLKTEERRRVEAKLALERLQAVLPEQIKEAERELELVASDAEKLRELEGFEEADLSKLGLEVWRGELKSAAATLAAGHVVAADELTKEVGRKVDRLSRQLREHRGGGVKLDEMKKKLDAVDLYSDHEGGAGRLAQLRQTLKRARDAHGRGDFKYQMYFAEVEAGYAGLLRRNEEAKQRGILEKRQREMRVERERRKAEDLAATRSLALKTGAGGGAIGLTLLGVMGNRGRRRVKEEAERLLAFRKEEMKGTVDRLFKLMDRAALVVGTEAELDELGYVGETLSLSKKGIAAVDEAFVLSSYVQGIIEKGEALVYAGNPVGGFQNLVTRGRYEKAVALLDDEVICDPGKPPALPGADEGKVPKRLGLGDDGCGDFTVELPEWKARMDAMMDEAEAAIERVDVAWATMIPRSEVLAKEIGKLDGMKASVDAESKRGWFECEGVFAKWVPAMRQALEDGLGLGKGDPVAALNGPISEGERMVAEGSDLVGKVLAFRRVRWDGIGKAEEALDRRGRATVWIDHRLDELSERVDELSDLGREKSVAQAVEEYGEELDQFGDRVEMASALTERAEVGLLPAVVSAGELVRKTREELGRELGVDAERVLSEGGDLNPSEFLVEAGKQREAALLALDRGEVLAAEGALNEGDGLVARAESLVAETGEAFENYESERAGLISAREELGKATAVAKKVVEDLRSRYAARALALEPEDEGSDSYGDAPTRLDEALVDAGMKLERAAEAYRGAALLEARGLLRAGDARVKAGDGLCRGALMRHDELENSEKKNKGNLSDREREAEDLDGEAKDRRVTKETLSLLAQAVTKLARAGGMVNAEPAGNDPYLAGDLLDDVRERLSVIRGAIGEDRVLYEKATELMEVVKLSRREAEDLAHAAGTDRIPDSTKTSKCVVRILDLGGELDELGGGLQEDHGNWLELQEKLRLVHLRYGEVSVELREELRLAREAIRAIENAGSEVRKASNWRGSYGVRVSGSMGSRALTEANRAMMHGEYRDGLTYAAKSYSLARRAIARAEAEEFSRRRAVEAAAAAARRRRRSSSSSFSNSSFGSSSSSFGSGGSSSSSVGRSSFSSGSGVGRSGW